MDKMVKLRDMVGEYSRETGICNTYNWYRGYAQKYGYILIGDTKISAHKTGGTWFINLSDFDQAVTGVIQKKAKDEKYTRHMMDDYKKRIFHRGGVWISDSRYYDNRGDFRLEGDTSRLALKDSEGIWYCNTCNRVAETEHNNPACHICSDWVSCGLDYTLSRVYCPCCGKSIEIQSFFPHASHLLPILPNSYLVTIP
ncbi:MAG: hypothetical protein WCC86_07765 [Methanoregula sp.]|uniref:hypothetical protein n=1 Tax=Methanoregula sp. TaxID=2052170 RepID=UPI003BAFC4CA